LVTGGEAKFLDAGCGPGDFIELFLKMNAKVVGIDASLEVVKEARRRFAGDDRVRVEAGHIEALKLPDETFDLVITVTVLQHIIDVHDFIKAVKNLVRVTQRDGHILIFEVAPEKLSERWPSMSHLAVRTRDEYLRVFKETGAKLIHEMCIPEIGIRLLTSYDNLVASLRAKLFCSSRAEITSSTSSSRLQNFIRKSILLLSKPFDYLFLWLPFPKGYSDMRILIFKRAMDEDSAFGERVPA
jgi:ubiquinone/menaquinone biosynthesis C-methylase UbiE